MSARTWNLTVLLALGAGAFAALERYSAYAPVQAQAELRQVQTEEAQRIGVAYPDAFGAQAVPMPLKSTVQAAVARHGVSVTFLAESEKDLGKGLRERNVIARLVNVPQAKLVAFLADMEAQGGARVKELQLKPAKDRSGSYEEAEAVVSQLTAAAAPARGTDKKEHAP